MTDTLNGQQPTHPFEILVVDDHREIADLVAEALHDEGYHVRVAHDGLSAIEAVRQHRPALLILDVTMPVLTGDEVLVRLRSEGPADLPIILMTADRAPERFSGLGANELLRKPFDIGHMIRLVASCLSFPPSPGRLRLPSADARAA